MFFKKSKQKKVEYTPVQYIAFPVAEFDNLSKAEKDYFYSKIREGRWEFSLRAFGWLVETRTSRAALPDHADGSIFGIKGARPFSENEYEELHELFRISNESETSLEEEKLKKPFEDFAIEGNFTRVPYLRALMGLRSLAAQGHAVKVDELQSAALRKLGNIQVLFGDRLAEVLEFQNSQARQIHVETE